MTQKVDIKEFAIRVERLCDFLLAKVDKDGSNDVKVLQDLKEDASHIQFNDTNVVSETIAGLSEHMKGVNVP